jgi:hypothetical protein
VDSIPDRAVHAGERVCTLLEAFVAGLLAGTIMGLTSQAYWLIVFAYRPPEVITSKGQSSPVANLVLLGGLLITGAWVILGGLLAMLFEAARPEQRDLALVPSIPFAAGLVFLATIVLIPALFVLQRWMKHIFLTYILFIGIFGLLIPNLVLAVHD